MTDIPTTTQKFFAVYQGKDGDLKTVELQVPLVPVDQLSAEDRADFSFLTVIDSGLDMVPASLELLEHSLDTAERLILAQEGIPEDEGRLIDFCLVTGPATAGEAIQQVKERGYEFSSPEELAEQFTAFLQEMSEGIRSLRGSMEDHARMLAEVAAELRTAGQPPAPEEP